MSPPEFELAFDRMKLQALPANVSCEATFAPGSYGDTLTSGPRAELTAVDPAAQTLPRLVLQTPEAARGDAPDDTELISVGVIGEGGMGRVLLARQHSLGREVAVKVLKPGAANEGAAAALVEEARTTGSLEHPGVVPVYALARDGAGMPALVMKRVDGVSWRALIHDEHHPAWKTIAIGRDPLEGNLEVLIQVCNAVAYAHRQGVIHRDLKPANVLVGELGEVYVADWGVAFQKAGLRPGPPRLIGTPAYMAPEMATGDAALMDERTDVYLLGGTLHEVLTGDPPHPGANLREVLELAWISAPPKFGPQVSSELAQVCTRALAANPAQRYQSVVELRDALRLFIVHRGATRLADAAAIRLKKLETIAVAGQTEAEARGWYALVSECRFGFASALETHPEDAAARAGLERCLAVAAQSELERERAPSARAFLSEMKAPPPQLEQALQALETVDRERIEGGKRLQQLDHERNIQVSFRQRTLVYVTMLTTIALLILFFGTDDKPAIPALGGWERLLPLTILGAVFGLCVVIGRKALLSTRLNRQLMAVLGAGCLFLQLNRVAAVLLGVSVESSMVSDGIIVAALLNMCALVLETWFISPALIALAGVAIGLIWPEHAAKGFSFGATGGFVLAVVLYRRLRRKKEGDERRAAQLRA